jgi:predicted aspartyl protease
LPPGRTWVTGPDVDLTLRGDDDARPPERLAGLIDTGASVICVDSRVTKRPGLVATDRKFVQMADGRTTTSTVYRARTSIPDLGFDDYVQVCGIEMDFPSTRVLLGRSFLRNYIVNYNGPTERFEFHEVAGGDDFYLEHDE